MTLRLRVPAFVAVGAIGFVLQLGVLHVLAGVLRWAYPLATMLAVEAAVLNNFGWHERWTWRDRAGHAGRLHRLIRYHLSTGLISVAGNVLVTVLAIEWLGLPTLPANAVAVVVLSVANFLVADRWVFSAPVTASFLALFVLLPHGASAADLRGLEPPRRQH